MIDKTNKKADIAIDSGIYKKTVEALANNFRKKASAAQREGGGTEEYIKYLDKLTMVFCEEARSSGSYIRGSEQGIVYLGKALERFKNENTNIQKMIRQALVERQYLLDFEDRFNWVKARSQNQRGQSILTALQKAHLILDTAFATSKALTAIEQNEGVEVNDAADIKKAYDDAIAMVEDKINQKLEKSPDLIFYEL